MADAIISAIIGDVVSRAVSLLIGRFISNNQESAEDKLQRMRRLVIRIHSVVEEAKGRQISNNGTLQLLSDLIDGDYQGCYLLDSVRCGGEADRDDDASSRRHDDTGGVDEIERVLQRLQVMSGDLREFILLLQGCKPIRRPLATSIFRDAQMFGRHVEKERIINFLLHEDDYRPATELGVLPIVGDSGVGKTTLVQYACDDARVRAHFPVIMLYSFTSTYDVKNNQGTSISDDPLELIKSSDDSFWDRHRRCLMIFEDVDMCRKQMLEEFLQNHRRSEAAGVVKMIVTTNNRRVANDVGTVEPIVLRPLPCPEFWFFFKAHAFDGRDVEENPRLISAGKAIARKLNGSFFGAKIIGGVLRDHRDPRVWCKALRSSIGGMSPLGDGVSYISDLAGNLLPGHVDMCRVTLSKDPPPAFLPETAAQRLAMFKDLHGAVPHDNVLACCADDARFARVLLCKSVLPFFNHYYIARCSCTCTVGSKRKNSCRSSTDQRVDFCIATLRKSTTM
uniref:NB-ARC domain-containing protein n=1 Tax=Zea mays TaxID=4577 RepID=A0A804N5W8_MAIZE